MKVLLDENMPRKLRWHLPGHEVSTVAYRGWAGLKNGRLLSEAAAAGFQVLVTADQNLSYQQNLHRIPLGMVVVSRNEWRWIEAGISAIARAVGQAAPGTTQLVKL